MSPKQCKAARALLGWSQIRLASNCGVGLSTLKLFETGEILPRPRNVRKIYWALCRQGISFSTEGPSGGMSVILAAQPNRADVGRPEIRNGRRDHYVPVVS